MANIRKPTSRFADANITRAFNDTYSNILELDKAIKSVESLDSITNKFTITLGPAYLATSASNWYYAHDNYGPSYHMWLSTDGSETFRTTLSAKNGYTYISRDCTLKSIKLNGFINFNGVIEAGLKVGNLNASGVYNLSNFKVARGTFAANKIRTIETNTNISLKKGQVLYVGQRRIDTGGTTWFSGRYILEFEENNE